MEFEATIQKWILASEGGYVDHREDPGGATNMGITQERLSLWRGRKVTKQEVRNLTREEALQIYKAHYWDAVRGDELPLGLDYAVFDYAVNSGPAKAVKDLQRELGFSGKNVDGIMGPMTLAAVHAVKDIPDLILRLCERRWQFVQSLKHFKTFGKGWRRRIWGEQMGVQDGDTGVADRAIKLAKGQAQAGAKPKPAPERAYPEEPSALDTLVKDPGGLSGIAGAIATILGAIANQPILQLAALALIGFLVWRLVLSRKQADPA